MTPPPSLADVGTHAVPTVAAETTSVASIPWFLWCSALAVTSAYLGIYTDVSWHRSIGRDTLWSPPHLAIHACGVLAGISSGYLIFTTTFGRRVILRDVSVRVWGLSGPLGAFVTAWGGAAMLTSVPFDNWWHGAYGLDVRILSPPHMVLALGFLSIAIGTLLLLLAFMNRATGPARTALLWLFLYVAGLVLADSLLAKLDAIDRSDMHMARFYIVVAIGTPAIFVAFATASRYRWACATIAGVYTTFGLVLLWLLPFVPAQPRLGPVYRQVTHFIPWEFPLLILVPAVALDLLLSCTAGWRPLLRATLLGSAFLGTFILVQWPFAEFLMTPAARNWFFGAAYIDFLTPPDWPSARFLFAPDDGRPQFARGMLIALVVSCTMAWLGLHAGRGMQKVKR